MKNILVVLGLVASTSFTMFSISSAHAVPSKSEVNKTTIERWTTNDYKGKNEDGEAEDIDTKKAK
ncbi:hypothetical protein PCC9214_02297 [Planktothrix tepida]|uniref:Uncharacterized protein n=1 Tax=Planktothrix pseudagardhii TaxID=132604 RepID=A0A9W4CNG6_9CYAN|nr:MULTISPECIES: hypothetical protein [Planktothrix]MBD2483112.1 hypothetical protein [Planktothrix sp. FACHB-1365]CAD5946847.1 hypothetical protein PCC9214_02297 [Planktothrix tepida]CAD5964109.1 hypothetical protein NO713_03388 [Planktothrix pseudagardhii]